MKLIVAGSRTIKKTKEIEDKILEYFTRTEKLVTGGCRGPDAIAIDLAKRERIPILVLLPSWRQFGPSAGPIRNAQMADYGDELLAFWDGKSKGTKNMIECMKQRKKPVTIVESPS